MSDSSAADEFNYGDNRDYGSGGARKRVVLPIALLAQAFGIAMLVLVIYWMVQFGGGFSWTVPSLVFNYHPIFMVTGLIFCFGDGMLIYRVFPNVPKMPLKIAHGTFMVLAIALSAAGLKSAFDSHTLRNIPHMYSLHSWIGIVTISLFGLQWLLGFLTFLLPCAPQRLRQMALPIHTSLGIYIFVCAIVACVSGITEKNIFDGQYALLPTRALISNFMGMCLMVFGGIVVYLVTRHDYRRVEA